MPNQTAQDIENDAKGKKSIPLTAAQQRAFKKYAKKYTTKIEGARRIGVNRNTLHSILKGGTCAQATYDMLIEKQIIPAA